MLSDEIEKKIQLKNNTRVNLANTQNSQPGSKDHDNPIENI
jgi:hypothetical protein